MAKRKDMPILKKIQAILKEHNKEAKLLRVSNISYEEKRTKGRYILDLVEYLHAFRLYYAMCFKNSNELIETKDLIRFEMYFHTEYQSDNMYAEAISFIRADIQRLIMQDEGWKAWVSTIIYDICLSMYLELLASDIVYEAPMNNIYRMNRLRNFEIIVSQNLKAYQYTKYGESYRIMYSFISSHEAIVREAKDVEDLLQKNNKLLKGVHIRQLGFGKQSRITASVIALNYKNSISKKKADLDEEVIIYEYKDNEVSIYGSTSKNSVFNYTNIVLIRKAVLEEVVWKNRDYIQEGDLIIPLFIKGLDSEDNYIVLRKNRTIHGNVSHINPFRYYTSDTITEALL